jgi:hypothetical protein
MAGGKEVPVHIESVDRRHTGGNRYDVDWTDEFGDPRRLHVTATDEMDAYTKAVDIVRRKREVAKHITYAVATCVLAVFLLIGYGCSQPSFAESCIIAGKVYVEREREEGTPGILVCGNTVRGF